MLGEEEGKLANGCPKPKGSEHDNARADRGPKTDVRNPSSKRRVRNSLCERVVREIGFRTC